MLELLNEKIEGSTIEYNAFKLLDYNRSLNRSHINELKKSIQENGYMSHNPIVVNEEYEIVDGQHRFIACKEMGLPIQYKVVRDGEKFIIPLNTTQRNWTSEDYVNYYADKSFNPSYSRVQRLVKDLGVPATTVVLIGQGIQAMSGNISRNIKTGNLQFSSEQELRTIAFFSKVQKLCEKSISGRTKPTGRFISAVMDISSRRGFKWETLMEKATKYPTLFYPCRNKQEAVEMLEKLYNHATRKEENRI